MGCLGVVISIFMMAIILVAISRMATPKPVKQPQGRPYVR
mgnify:CR=1 FL=1